MKTAGRILDFAVGRAGGWELWDRVVRFDCDVRAISGPLPVLLGQSRTFPKPTRVELYPQEQRVVFHDFPENGKPSIYIGGRGVSVKTGLRPWRPDDALDFFGSSLCGYLSWPLLLKSARKLEVLAPLSATGACLRATLNPGRRNHSLVQDFRFDAKGSLIRNDFTAEVIGGWAQASLINLAPVSIGGLTLASTRRVYPRIGRARLPLALFTGRLENLSVEFSNQAPSV